MEDDDKAHAAEAVAATDVGASHHSAKVDGMALEEEEEADDDDDGWAFQTLQDAPRDS